MRLFFASLYWKTLRLWENLTPLTSFHANEIPKGVSFDQTIIRFSRCPVWLARSPEKPDSLLNRVALLTYSADYLLPMHHHASSASSYSAEGTLHFLTMDATPSQTISWSPGKQTTTSEKVGTTATPARLAEHARVLANEMVAVHKTIVDRNLDIPAFTEVWHHSGNGFRLCPTADYTVTDVMHENDPGHGGIVGIYS
jgi:hypothetical protein